MGKGNYYLVTFIWNTLQKVFNAIVGFITVPLLLNYFGADKYGILSLATACNGYMHLLDLGMNTGAVRYFSMWRADGNTDMLNKVSRTNITFYGIIAIINALLLVIVALFGESWFSLNPEQFYQLQKCLIIIALFSIVSWGATTFNQQLIADKQMAYTSQIQTIMVVLKLLLIGCVFWFNLSLDAYFFFLTAITASVIVPYIIKCKRSGLISTIKPGFYWSEFRTVFLFSMSIFALSLFQMTSTQTRPIILGMFATQGPSVNAEYRILEVVPQLVIMIAATFSSMFLPKTTELVVKSDNNEICKFAYKWTLLTTIITCCLCFPFILGSKDVLIAYVGQTYGSLSIWLILWLVTTLVQVYSSPSYSLIMAYGKTKKLVYISAVACVLSLIINAMLAPSVGVGSAVIGYFVYIFFSFICYYLFYYKQVLHISRVKIFMSFAKPTICAVSACLITYYLFDGRLKFDIGSERVTYLVYFCIKTLVWAVTFGAMVLAFRLIRIDVKERKVITKYDI